MAESSMLWTTNNTGDGPTAGYTQTQLFQMMRSFARTANLGGVFPDVLNELAVTGTATPVSVNTGQAICYGIPYFNSASVTVAIATPASLTRVDRIVLRASWAAQTVRITRIAGTEGAGTPAMTQTAGTTWDIPLANVSITTGGVITVTDAREWANGIGDNAVDNTKLSQAAADTMKGNFTASTGNLTDTGVATVLAQYIHAATSKTTPISADEFAVIDSAASNVLKRVTLANLAIALGFSSSTFTPTLTINDSAAGITYATQTGYYLKVGTFVFFHILVELANKGASVGNVKIGNLPFTAATINSGLFTPINFAGFENLATSAYSVTFDAIAGTTLLQGRINTAAAALNFGAVSSSNHMLNTHVGNSSGFMVTGSYISV